MSDGVTGGSLVDDRFRLITQLGGGHSGQVWQAVDERTGRHVAVKLYRHRPAPDPATVVSHPCVVSILFLGTHEGIPYVVMELVEGVSLATVLEEGPVPAEDTAAIALGICEALHAAHAAGVIHGNLKPSNVLLADGRGRHPVVKVGDFTGHGDAREDMYSVGLLMEAMSGRRNPVVDRMLSRDPYTAAQLRAVLTGDAFPSAPAEEEPEPDRRRLTRLAVISGTTTLAVIVAACAWMLQPPTPPDLGSGAPIGTRTASVSAGGPLAEPSAGRQTTQPPPAVPPAGASLNSLSNSISALNDVKSVIAGQLKAGNIEQEAASMLNSRLDDIMRFQSRGQTKQANDRIESLRTQLESMHRAKKVTAAGYDAILASVNKLST